MDIHHKLQQQKNTEELSKVDGNCMNIEYPDIHVGYGGSREPNYSQPIEAFLENMNRNMRLIYGRSPVK